MIIKQLKNTQPHKEAVREYDLKEKLAILCVRHIKKYAKQKLASLEGENRSTNPLKVSAFKRLIKIRRYDIEYATLVSILFSNEFLQIKDRVTSGRLNLSHISSEGYWSDGGRNVGIIEAIHFSYTFFNEAYPQIDNIIELMLLAAEVSDSPLDEMDFIEKIIGCRPSTEN